jgi:pyruvate kinase
MPVRRAKVVATLGPASATEADVAALVAAGVDVARVNASHGTPAEHAALIAMVRDAAERAGRPVAVLLDLQGPRIRVGALESPAVLEPGQEIVFAPEGRAAPGQIPTTFDLAADVRRGTRILLDDGVIAAEVTGVRPPLVDAVVRYGGRLTSHKGINLPGVNVSVPPLTDKDRIDAAFAVGHDVDYVGLSYVRRAEDIAALRALLPAHVRVVAKIEKDTALEDVDRIAEAADAVMVARGDLGVELPFELVPLAQKRVIRVALRHRRPVITATQMLESMLHCPRPTRAEASDVANAILDGTDAVMLSGETAVGEFPREAVQAMDRIIRAVEADAMLESRPESAGTGSGGPVRSEHAVAAAAVVAARMLRAPIIVTFTKSGFSARMVAASRPPVPVLGVTDDRHTYRQLALVWGVVPMLTDQPPNYEAMLGAARGRILERGFARQGDRVVVTAGVPFHVPGTTNLVKVEEV